MVVARYNTDGGLASSFSGDGKVAITFAGMWDQGAEAIVHAGTKVVVGGWAVNPVSGSFNPHNFVLARFNADGSLDSTFHGDGKVETDFASTTNEQIRALVIDASGRIVAGGFADGQFALARYNTNGNLDTTFDGDGKVLTSVPSFLGSEGINGLYIQADGCIVAVGSADQAQIAIVRYNPNGSLDTTFDGDGKVSLAMPGFRLTANDVARDIGGKMVVVGEAYENGTEKSRMLIARYLSSGALDTEFSGDGIAFVDFASTSRESANAVVVDYYNSIIVGGYAGNDFALARVLHTGNLDTSFDGDGKVITAFASGVTAIEDLAFKDSKIIAVGGVSNTDVFAGARYNLSNGSLDTTFDGDGKLLTDFGGTGDGTASAVVVDAFGKVTAAGWALY
jgi:uncharacterized delta-60 repeat protein